MLNILLDGISILNTYKEGVSVFFIVVFSFGFLTLKSVSNDQLDTRVRVLASFSLGTNMLITIAYMVILLAYFWTPMLKIGSFVIFISAILILLKEIWQRKPRVTYDFQLIITGMALFLLLLARLSFLEHVLLPPYSDSPIHYQIVSGILNPQPVNYSKLSLGNIFVNYYHFGFHGMVAWLASITNINIGNAISLLGQLFLVITPISVLFLIYVITRNINGALFGGLLAAVGWLMPAFAVNWGKFPALSSLAIMPAVVGYIILYLQSNTKKPITIFYGLILSIGIALMHTRIIICLLLAAIAYFVSGKLQLKKELGFPQSIRLTTLYIISLWPLSQVLINFYVGYPLLIILAILLPFAFKEYPRISVGVFFYTSGLWLVGLAPLLVNKNSQTLLDLQFLEIMLYIPFAILGGAGFAGLLKNIPSTRAMQWGAILLLISGVMFNFTRSNTLYPNSCCDYFKDDDQNALQWLHENTSENSLVIISTSENNGKMVGTDAGIWIYPLLGRSTNKLPFNTNLQSSITFQKICETGAKEIYIYMGGREFSFANDQIMHLPWARQMYKSGKAMIYQVVGCLN